jgi:hypothetical protein
MPTNLPDQNWTVPSGTDLADNPLAFTDFAADVLQTVVLRYPNTATRDAFNGSRVAGDISFTTGNTWYDRWTGLKWIPINSMSVYKTASQVVNNSTALVNDNHLFLPLPSLNTVYSVEGYVEYNSSTTADFKFGLAIPAGASTRFMASGLATGAAAATGDGNFQVQTTGGTLAYGGAGVGTRVGIHIAGVVQQGATAGNVTFQWAQNTLDATNTTVDQLSWLRIMPIS